MNLSPKNLEFDEINIGDTKELYKLIKVSDINEFAKISGDYSSIHMDDDYAKENGFEGRIAHGALLISWLSRIIGMELPGKKSILVEIKNKFFEPMYINDEIKITVEVISKSEATKYISLKSTCKKNKKIIAKGLIGVLIK